MTTHKREMQEKQKPLVPTRVARKMRQRGVKASFYGMEFGFELLRRICRRFREENINLEEAIEFYKGVAPPIKGFNGLVMLQASIPGDPRYVERDPVREPAAPDVPTESEFRAKLLSFASDETEAGPRKSKPKRKAQAG